MGKKNRQARRAARKTNRAARKTSRAARKRANAVIVSEKVDTRWHRRRTLGLICRAEKLELQARELEINSQELTATSELTKGVTAVLHGLNPAGGCLMTVTWNYELGDQSPIYDHHELDARSSYFRQREVEDRNIAASQFTWSTSDVIPNIRYVVKVFGAVDASGSTLKLIGRCIATKIR